MIDYKLISSSIDYYTMHGFTYVDVPWAVEKKFSDITMPPGRTAFQLGNSCLVGSGEQSFLQTIISKNIKGAYCCVTPCFRDEQEDELHKKWFLKTELIDTDCTQERLHKIIELCKNFYNQYLPVSIIKTEADKREDLIEHSTYDIVFNNIELGSYGIRKHNIGEWIYATGCAEPRLSIAINKFLENEKVWYNY